MDKDATAPIITIKANIDATVKEIRGALTDTQVQIFKKTCFGHWLDISLKRNNQLLIHTLLTCMVASVANELSFLISGKRIRFRRQEFCLVTGLRFGSNMYMKEWVKNMAKKSFRNRIFPDIEARSVKLSDVIAIFYKMRGKLLFLEDNDAIWILEAIPATYVYVSKEPMEKIPRAFAWKMILPFSWARCCTLFVGDNLAPPLETLTPTKAESESDWWKTSLEYFEGKGVQSEAVSEQLEIEKDGLSEEVQKKKKRKRGSSPPSFQNPTYEQLMTRVSTLEGTVTTLTQTVSSLQGSIGTLESRLFALEGDARVSTLTQTVSSLQGTIATLESRLLALEGDERDFGVVSDGDIAAYSSKLRVRRTPLKLKSPMRCYSRKSRSCTIPPPPASTTMPPVTTTKDTHLDDSDAAKDAAKDTHLDAVTTISVPMTTTEKTLKDIIHIDASDPTQETGHRHTEDELKIIRIETTTKKPSYDLPDLTKIKRCKYPIFTTFEKKKTDCYLDCLPKGRVCETSFWDILWPGGENVDYMEQGMLDGLHINAFIELMMRKRPHNAQWTLGLSELVAFHIDSGMRLSMVSVVDALRATIDGTNP
ncbi:hypothetical protein Tco_0675714, partial [Tanacetum coccineum]